MNVKIPFTNLGLQYLSIQPEIDAAIARVLRSGQFILGQEVNQFEREFATYCGVAHAIGVGSGTSAIQLALLACGLEPGDEVITVSNTAVASVAAVELAGAQPVLVDIDPLRYTLDPARLAAALSPRSRAILVVHLFGCPADMEPILSFADRHHLFVIEDCAQAHGARYNGRMVGSLGHLAAYSFYPTKNLGAYGDGGAVLTGDPLLAARLRRLRQYGWNEQRISLDKGLNSRLDEMQAAILRVKLTHLDQWNDRRRELAAIYNSSLSGAGLVLPIEPSGTRHVYHQFVVRCHQRDELAAFLAENGIETRVHYPLPIHSQPAYRSLDIDPGALCLTESAANEILSLPIRPDLSEEDISAVCRAIRFFQGQRIGPG